MLIHTAGFDHDAGVFRIFDVWETREHGERFIKDRLNPILEPMMAAADERGHGAAEPRDLVRAARLDDGLRSSTRPGA